LLGELSGWTQIRNPIAVELSSPLTDKSAYEGLAGSSRKLNRNVPTVPKTRVPFAQHVALVNPQRTGRPVTARESAVKLLRISRRRVARGSLFERHPPIVPHEAVESLGHSPVAPT
jgi:hypothetical protein